MEYRCERCGAVLTGGAIRCGACGREFAAPVPKEPIPTGPEAADSGVDALLRDRTAARTAAPQAGSAAPYYSSAPAPRRPTRRVGLIVGISLAVALTGGVVWGVSVLWMRGPGGEAEFRRHNLAGNAAGERGDFRKADDEYSQMIALRPKRVDGYLLRGISELQEGQPTAAGADDTAALALTTDPMSRGDLLANRAIAEDHQGRLTRAIADDTQSIQEYGQVRDPRMRRLIPSRVADNYRHRADVLWKHKDYARAIADCTMLLATSPHRPDDFGIRGKAESMLGQDAAARADFLQALRLDPTDADCYSGLGNIAEKHGQFAQAVAVFQRATQADPGNVQFLGSLGWFQYETGNYPAAIATDRQARQIDPNQEWINYNLALCYAVAGDRARANTAYADALAHGSPTDQKAALTDIRTALGKQPGSVALQAALQQVTQGRAETATAPRPKPVLPPPPLPQSAASFAAALGPEVTLGGYAIHPPAGYTLTQHPKVFLSGTGTVYLWSGPQRSDGTVPTMQVEIVQDDGSLAARLTSAQETQGEQQAMGYNHSQLVLSPVRACTLGRMQFARGDWQGIGQRTGKTYLGSEYCSVVPYWMVHLTSHDALPYATTTQPLLRASIQTFRKR